MPKKKTQRKRRRKSTPPRHKPFVPSPEPRVSADEVVLKPGKGSSRSGGGAGGHYWHVYLGDRRAGRAYVYLHEEGGESRPSITVELNQASRGRGIGTIAFRRGAEMSAYDEVYATVRKENVASRIALERAGYVPVEGWTGPQLLLVWQRGKSSDRDST